MYLIVKYSLYFFNSPRNYIAVNEGQAYDTTTRIFNVSCGEIYLFSWTT